MVTPTSHFPLTGKSIKTKDMKRLFFLCLFSLGTYVAQAQFQINLQGLDDLVIELNDVNKTATICCYDVRLKDGGPKNMSVDWRKVRRFIASAPKTLIIPASYKHPNTGVKYTITGIGDAAFAGIMNVSFVSIPPTVKDIGRYAFFGSSLVSINLPASIRKIGDRAFGNCTELVSLQMPKGAMLGDRLYAESPRIKVLSFNTGNEDNLAENVNVSKPIVTAPIVNSDVDVDIPILNSRNEETFAMIIANENYDDEVPVQYALHDGRIFKEYCEKVLGLNPKHIYYEENATLGKMNRLMERMVMAAEAFEGDAKFIVYYAGHGIPDETTGEAYLLPNDGSGQNLKTAFSLKTFYDELGRLNAKSVTVFLDACFSGAQRGEGMLMAARGVAIAPREETPQQGNTIVFSAASGKETAWPYNEKGHGLFTYFLLKKLRESNGEATLGELDSYIQKYVKRSIMDLGYDAKMQTPKATASPALANSWRTMKLK